MTPEPDNAAGRFLADVVDGLSRPQKTIPCRWFYDGEGSRLFEAITELPEYYPTRTETAILREHASDIAARIGPRAVVVEYGSGASSKTRILLDALDRPALYVPIDVSEDFLRQTAEALRADYPGLAVAPVASDFLSPIALPELPADAGRTVGFFPGSTVGNLPDADIVRLLSNTGRLTGPGGLFVLGFDLVKDVDTLLAAYDDPAGVTAAFNRNLLVRANRELGADFAPDRFRHKARWNSDESRVEMHLVSVGTQTVTINGQRFAFRDSESIHTENSRKFTLETMKALCGRAGWVPVQTHLDEEAQFAVTLMERSAA